jgi:hypothetical protein
MKNLSIHLFFILLVINAFGQSYEPFPENNAFWSAMHCESGPIVTKSAFVKVGVFGDTPINEKTYHKLYWLFSNYRVIYTKFNFAKVS